MQWDTLFAARTGSMKRNTIREFLKLANQPGMISFAGGLPAPEVLPADAMTGCVAAVVKRFGPSALQYGATEGVPELREWIAQNSSTPAATVQPENVLIVSGAQQGLDLLGRVLLDRDDQVVVENPTYLAALSAWMPLGVQFLGIQGDPGGVDVASLEVALRSRPKLAYIVPNFQNPQGTTLELSRRHRIADLLREHSVAMIEDDPYRELRFEGEDLPSLYSLQSNSDSVIHVGTFSKALAPGFRVGWVIAPKVVIDKLALAKQAVDLHTSTFSQYVVLELIRSGTLRRGLDIIRRVYRERRDAMLEALPQYFPNEVTWSRPAGGMFLLARLPEGIDTTALAPKAVEQRVLFVPGADFHVDGTGQNTMRLNFTRHEPNSIREGIRRLGAVIKDALATTPEH
jgi:2-aminoadipate transaminase